MGDANGLHHGGCVVSLIVVVDKHKHPYLNGQVRTVKIIVTYWTKVNMSYQTLLNSLSILMQVFTEVLPVLFIIFIMMEFVVAPLTVTSVRCRYSVVPHAVKLMAKIPSCQGSLCNSHRRYCHQNIPSHNCLSGHTLPPCVLPAQTKQMRELIPHESMCCSSSPLYPQRLSSLICLGK